MIKLIFPAKEDTKLEPNTVAIVMAVGVAAGIIGAVISLT